jgi:hypothetical protein
VCVSGREGGGIVLSVGLLGQQASQVRDADLEDLLFCRLRL